MWTGKGNLAGDDAVTRSGIYEKENACRGEEGEVVTGNNELSLGQVDIKVEHLRR